MRQNEVHTDRNQKTYYMMTSAQRWLGVRLELIAAITIFLAGLFAILSKNILPQIPVGLLGLSLSYVLQISNNLSMTIRQATETVLVTFFK